MDASPDTTARIHSKISSVNSWPHVLMRHYTSTSFTIPVSFLWILDSFNMARRANHRKKKDDGAELKKVVEMYIEHVCVHGGFICSSVIGLAYFFRGKSSGLFGVLCRRDEDAVTQIRRLWDVAFMTRPPVRCRVIQCWSEAKGPARFGNMLSQLSI